MHSVRSSIRSREGAMVAFRRDLHSHPEISFNEKRTSRLVSERLRGAGLEVRDGIAGTGLRALIRSGAGSAGAPHRSIFFRADMDALPIQEENTAPYASVTPGVMHACGHDGHTAILAETALLAMEMRGSLGGDLGFIFQPAEEGPGGALPMIREGVLESPRPEAVFGLHLWSELPIGRIAVTAGPAMAAADEFRLLVTGKGGHGAMPHNAVDALVVACHIVLALQTVVSRNLDPMKTGVLTLGTIEAGSNFNIIAEKAQLTGTVRTFDPQIRDMILRRLREIAEGTASALGAECGVTIMPIYPATVNDPEMSGFVADIAAGLVGEENVIRDMVLMGSEDMTYYLQEVPGCYLFLGAGNSDKGFTLPHHNPRFDFDEDAMALGCELFLRIAEEYFRRHPEATVGGR